MKIKLKRKEQIKIGCADDIYSIMQRVLMRENKIDRNREHFWTISLDNANRVLNMELISIGSVKQVIVEPMEVLSVPLQKRAVKIILVHNHPSQELIPSEADKDITDRLIQCGLIMHVPVLDHLIITEKSYFSFEATGLLKQLEASTKYVPPYVIKAEWEKKLKEAEAKIVKARDGKAKEMAKAMIAEGYTIEEIAKLTGLRKKAIQNIGK